MHLTKTRRTRRFRPLAVSCWSTFYLSPAALPYLRQESIQGQLLDVAGSDISLEQREMLFQGRAERGITPACIPANLNPYRRLFVFVHALAIRSMRSWVARSTCTASADGSASKAKGIRRGLATLVR